MQLGSLPPAPPRKKQKKQGCHRGNHVWDGVSLQVSIVQQRLTRGNAPTEVEAFRNNAMYRLVLGDGPIFLSNWEQIDQHPGLPSDPLLKV